jgi:antitoxin VapB
MSVAKVFMSGRSQAVRLPREFRFDTAEVYIRRTAEGVLLVPKRALKLGDALAEAFDRLPVDDGGSDFVRPDQGEHERATDLFGAGDTADRTEP